MSITDNCSFGRSHPNKLSGKYPAFWNPAKPINSRFVRASFNEWLNTYPTNNPSPVIARLTRGKIHQSGYKLKLNLLIISLKMRAGKVTMIRKPANPLTPSLDNTFLRASPKPTSPRKKICNITCAIDLK